jgi:hypothetical protein
MSKGGDYVSIKKTPNKVTVGKKKEEKLSIPLVNLSKGAYAYRQHVPVAPKDIESLEESSVLDLYTRNHLNTMDDSSLKDYAGKMKKCLKDKGTIFCCLPADYKDYSRVIECLEKADLQVHFNKINKDMRQIKARKISEKQKTPEKGFIWTSAYGGCWPEKCLHKAGHDKVTSSKTRTVEELRSVASKKDVDLLVMGNFIADRHMIKAEALRLGIDVIHGEDGFIPHYSTLHVDPMGFCWESSLPLTLFREDNVTDSDRKILETSLEAYRDTVKSDLYKGKQYVLLPLQLLGDRVNRFGLGISGSWLSVIKHARACVPANVDIVVKPHPRGKASGMASTKKWIETQANVHLDTRRELYTLMHFSRGVIGMNSTVLTEARIMMNKPVWAYAPSWYTNHTQLVYPLDFKQPPRTLPFVEELETGCPTGEYMDEYRLWYLKQLLSRQYTQKVQHSREDYRKWVLKRTYSSYKQHGESIFQLEGKPF